MRYSKKPQGRVFAVYVNNKKVKYKTINNYVRVRVKPSKEDCVEIVYNHSLTTDP